MNQRLALPSSRDYITQKVRIADQAAVDRVLWP